MNNDILKLEVGMELIIDGKSYGIVTEVTPPKFIRTATRLTNKLHKDFKLIRDIEIGAKDDN